ncbi:hypothetical protein GCM10010411_75700 [Actinomadura fulvescens]|uniref:Uncharacterized protein n=1 Tax=Actinomadura fulvescens TaxID=46160 RepID=A0ABP6CW08_9ACTN
MGSTPLRLLAEVVAVCDTSTLLERSTTFASVPAASPWDTDYQVNQSVLIARLTATEAQDWMWRAYTTTRNRSSFYFVLPYADQPGYCPPEPDELVAAVEKRALRQEPPAGVLTAVNAYSGTGLGPADLAYWAQQRARDEEEARARWEASRRTRTERLQLGPYFRRPEHRTGRVPMLPPGPRPHHLGDRPAPRHMTHVPYLPHDPMDTVRQVRRACTCLTCLTPERHPR